MKITVLTLFPEMLTSVLDASILGRARREGHLVVDAVDMRDFSTNRHRTVDDSPAGGGAGMVLQVDVVVGALRHARAAAPSARVVLLDARGRTFTQEDARRFAAKPHLVLVCGRYEGVDARVEDHVDEVVSLGDFVLTGGELGALVIIDAVARLVPGVLGNETSSAHESFASGTRGGALLEHRQYTRPVDFEGAAIPRVLLGGHHRDIARARRKDSLRLTAQRRPDLFVKAHLTREDDRILEDARVPELSPELSTESSTESSHRVVR